MQFHTLQRSTKLKRSQSVGRGGKRGKTSGRGTKGQNSRSGHKKRPELRDIIKTLPKLRGRGVNIFKSFQPFNSPINLELIEKHFKAGDIVSPATLESKGLVAKSKGAYPRVKILAHGEISKKLTFKDCRMSATAKAMIEKAGGMVK